MVYTRADPYLVAGGNKGSYQTELGMTRLWDNAEAASLIWQTTVKRSGVGAWKLTGGNQGSECGLMSSGTLAMGGSEGWVQMACRFESFPSSGRHQIMAYVTDGDGANQANLKPTASIDSSGVLWLQDSDGGNLTSCATLSLDTWYVILLHARGGAAGSLTHELFLYNGLTGASIASVSGSWAVGNSGSNNVCKWGNSAAGNNSGMVLYMEDLIAWKNLSTNPGPCIVYTLFPTAVEAAGNWTATGAADIPTAISDVNGGARTVTDLATTASDATITSATASFDSTTDINAEVNADGVTGGRLIASVTSGTEAEMSGTASATATGVTATIIRAGHNSDSSYASVNNATASNLELTLEDASIPTQYEIHTVIANAMQRHVTAPTFQLGVKSGGTTEVFDEFPNTSATYNPRRSSNGAAATSPSHPTDPATSAQWTSAAIDAMSLVYRDADALAREFRITLGSVDVIAAMVPTSAAGPPPDVNRQRRRALLVR